MLIACKIDIDYSNRNSSMMECATINVLGEVVCVNGASRNATVRSYEQELDGRLEPG